MADPKPYTDRQAKVGRTVTKAMSRLNNAVYKATDGKIWGKFLHGAPVCLLTTTGRKSGLPRTVSLIYLRDGEDVVIVASMGGMPKHPEWYLNLVATPECTIQIKGDTSRYIARVVAAGEKARLWPELLGVYPDYDTYQARTEREIPVIVCSPAI
jgi:deazaflavin-dependent oxidoreductase (nitroreductase family)